MGQEPIQSTNMFAPKFKAIAPQGTGIWTPKLQTPSTSLSDLNKYEAIAEQSKYNSAQTLTTAQSSIPLPPPIPSLPIWSPQSPISPTATAPKKEFRPVRFKSPTLPQRYVLSQNSVNVTPLPPWSSDNDRTDGYALPPTPLSTHSLPSLTPRSTSYTNISPATTSTGSFYTGYNDTAGSVPNIAPNSNVSDKIKTFERSASVTDVIRPFQRRYNHPAAYKPNEVIYKLKHEYMSEPELENERPRKMAHLSRHQYDGIGPVTRDGMPIILRSEVKEPHQHEWYKRLYQTIHKQKNNDDYVIRYKCRRGPSNYKSTGYLSEPEPNYDSDYSIKYKALDRRRIQPACSTTSVRSATSYQDNNSYGTMPNPIKTGQAAYKNQPGRIENYVTGQSSVSEKEKKENFEQAKLSPHYTEGNLSRALAKESGYTSDSNLVFRKKELLQQSPLSPVEQKQAYKYLQAGGEPPLLGFRKPFKPKDYEITTQVHIPPIPPTKGISRDHNGNVTESPNSRYYESDVNIHFKTPVRNEYKPPLSEKELAIRQAEHMQKQYQEERRRKYLQELQDMNARRHTDNFTPSQKSPIALNRYDDFQSDLAPKSPNIIYPKLTARALYTFQGQSARELSFKKGDIVYIRRQVDKNWYEGEYNAMIGLLPVTYVEILNREGVRQPPSKKPSEGQARAKFNFQAQSGVELSLNKGELVTLTRRVDDNWFEGKIANRKGIFPVTYVEVLTDIGAEDLAAKTVITDQSTINLRPSLDTLRTNINNEFNQITRNGHQPPNGILKGTRNLQKTDALHVDTSVVPLTYRALYKYRPQNSDELELLEGDVVQVLEQCDDGWFVGTSQRTGCFGTFPGNYVECI